MNTVREGDIEYNEEGNMVIAVEKNGRIVKKEIGKLSAKRWKKYRTHIDDSIRSCVIETFVMPVTNYLRTSGEEKEEISNLFMKLYEKLPLKEKEEFIKNNRVEWLDRNICQLCHKKANKKVKCIHHDCCGMCEECAKNIIVDKKCIGCKKVQTKTCPICLDEKEADQLCKSKNCHHHVCWSCYGKSHHCGNPIIKCPECRAVFNSENNDDTSDEEDINPILYEISESFVTIRSGNEEEEEDETSDELISTIEELVSQFSADENE